MTSSNKNLIDKLNREKALSKEEWTALIAGFEPVDREYAASLARAIALKRFGPNIFFRGIVEFTNICKNNC